MIAIIISVLGIAGTLIAWFFNPKQAAYRELDNIQQQLELLYAKRDKALAAKDSNTLSLITLDITRLFTRRNEIRKRLR